MYFAESVIWRAIIQILHALDYIHSRKIIHRDIKSGNIFINIKDKKNLEKTFTELDLLQADFKIGDFNISTETQSGFQKTLSGTPFFASPEMLARQPYSFQSDVWQLGITLYQFATLTFPYEGNTVRDIRRNQQNMQLKDLPPCYSKQLQWVIFSMLELNPMQRLLPSNLIQAGPIKQMI